MKDELYLFRRGFNYSQDGPGNRLVYHLKGCNLICPWCSNPEGMLRDSSDKPTPVEDLVREAISCKPMFFDGGGVTLTGGEVCLQADAAKNLLCKLKAEKIHTAIESNASTPGFRKILPYVDYIMVDFKSANSLAAKTTIGTETEPITENIKYALSSGYELHIRIPLIHNFNDDKEERKRITDTLKNLRGKFDVEILPYHEYGKQKWEQSGREYTVTDGFVSAQTVSEFSEELKSAGIRVIKT